MASPRISMMAAVLVVACGLQTRAQAQTVTCAPKQFRPSLVRIEHPGRIQGSGVVIVKRDAYVVVLTVQHVMPDSDDFTLVFQVAPERPLRVKWSKDLLLAVPPDSDLVAFRVDGAIPPEVVPEDPFTRGVPAGASLASWGYPSATGATLCSYEGTLRELNSGQVVIGGEVPEGVSGGPVFFLDPEDGAPKLAGIVVRGDERNTQAIDIRQAVTIVTTSPDRRNGNRPHAWPNIPLPIELRSGPIALLTFRHIPAGTFSMGGNRAGDERWPGTGNSGAATVRLPAFYMAQYEVTSAAYQACVSAAACPAVGGDSRTRGTNLPVVGVTWHGAMAYARWAQGHLLSRPETDRTLRRLLEAGWRIDLPSEEEWEKAARKNGTAVYPWGDSRNNGEINFNTGRLRPVDESKCSGCAYGLFDMAGNAREWTRSLKLPYGYDASMAENASAPGKRAIRGGSYRRSENPVLVADTIRSANRQEAEPSAADEFTGFRLALVCRPDGDRPCTWQEPD